MTARQLAQELRKLQQAYRDGPRWGELGFDDPLTEFAKELARIDESAGTTLKWSLTWATDDTRRPL